MSTPKKIDFNHLYSKDEREATEVLIRHLRDLMLKDPQKQKKAALIIEGWLQQKPKK